MNFNLSRKRSTPTIGCTSIKNENVDNKFIKKLKEFSCYNLYPDSQQGVDILSEILRVDNHNIAIGNGSESLLRNLFLVLDYTTIQILDHSYEMAFFYNRLLDKSIITNPLSFSGKFFFEDIRSLGGELLYLVNPHCPACLTFDNQQIESYSKQFKYVIVDEAYTNPLRNNFIELHNVIYVRTFSKLGGVPGLRLGYAVGPQDIIQKLHCLRDSYEITTSSIKFLRYITNHKTIIDEHEQELGSCYRLLKSKHAGFSASCANFAVFDSTDYIGKKFSIKDKLFTRVTLTDSEHYENLYCR